MKDNLENIIDKKLNEDIEIPVSILKKRNKAFEMIRNDKKKKNNWGLVAAIAFIFIMTISFGDDVVASVKELVFKNNKGVQQAIDYGYYQNLDNKVIKDNNVEYTIDKLVVDDSKLAISMKINIKDEALKENLEAIKVEYNVLAGNENVIRGVDSEFTIDDKTKEVTYNSTIALSDEINYEKVTLEITNLVLGTNLNSDISWDNTLSKEDINQISEEGLKVYKIISGNWETEINLNNIKEVLQYKEVETDENIKVISAKLSATAMEIRFNFNSVDMEKDVYNVVNKMELKDENGIIYNPSESISQYLKDDNKIDFVVGFDATSFEASKSYVLEYEDLQGKKFNLVLIKN